MFKLFDAIKRYWWILIFAIGAILSIIIRSKIRNRIPEKLPDQLPESYLQSAEKQIGPVLVMVKEAQDQVVDAANQEREILENIQNKPNEEERLDDLAGWMEDRI